jgi:Zn-dependent protease
VCLLFALCVHEAAHAIVADWRGDPSPRFMGRVTLNPLAHIDPIGTVVMPLVMMITGGAGFLLGWAKPVQFNPVNLKNMHRDPVFIAAAGPVANLLLAVGSLVALRIAITIFGLDAIKESPAIDVFSQLLVINVVLFFFNLIPLPPLDGHHVLRYFLPLRGQQMLDRVGFFGIIIALIIVSRTPILWAPASSLINAMSSVALWGVS